MTQENSLLRGPLTPQEQNVVEQFKKFGEAEGAESAIRHPECSWREIIAQEPENVVVTESPCGGAYIFSREGWQ